ncbi:MAG: hypothetical protein KBS98_06975 [Flavobacterium sp.]|nr:hypothetical protein [Candidatus Neoflavobacterium equi]
MIPIVAKYLIPKGFSGLTIYPFVFVNKKGLLNNKVLINHEHIHIKQQLELLILPFFIWYGLEYIYRLIQYRNAKKAYRNISFEREAYANERNFNYVKTRKIFMFLKYT